MVVPEGDSAGFGRTGILGDGTTCVFGLGTTAVFGGGTTVVFGAGTTGVLPAGTTAVFGLGFTGGRRSGFLCAGGFGFFSAGGFGFADGGGLGLPPEPPGAGVGAPGAGEPAGPLPGTWAILFKLRPTKTKRPQARICNFFIRRKRCSTPIRCTPSAKPRVGLQASSAQELAETSSFRRSAGSCILLANYPSQSQKARILSGRFYCSKCSNSYLCARYFRIQPMARRKPTRHYGKPSHYNRNSQSSRQGRR